MSNIYELPTALTREHDLRERYSTKVKDLISTFMLRYPQYEPQATIVENTTLTNLNYLLDLSLEDLEDSVRETLHSVLAGYQPELGDSFEGLNKSSATAKMGNVATKQSNNNVIPLFK